MFLCSTYIKQICFINYIKDNFGIVRTVLGLQANSNKFLPLKPVKKDTFLKVPLQFLHCRGLDCTGLIIQGRGNFTIHFFYLVQELFS